ncbi:hypothetical protein [Nocardioides euryhalodurans]|uniref:Uncharacterized protein n=1 Tax=Nocardioides euryhalodurans TaxID=2518370 RepID=A0A4P7GHF9_9ACTN|nr:hypothetical protein [Nocardioides euryhalodurans]QBR91099.1 hypothetical protein EXE57_01555 [Nocardioides euryhalodurans]
MRATPTLPSGPEVLLRGGSDRRLTQGLVALSVHVVDDGRATAEVEVTGHPEGVTLKGAKVGASTLAIRLTADEDDFIGGVTEVETRLVAGAAPTTVLRADGTARVADSATAVTLTFGAEIQSGSVRRRAGGTIARCRATAPGLRHGSRITLATPGRGADADLEVVEIWHRFDAAHGLWVELVART